MPSLQIHDLPDNIYQLLQKSAQANNRSISQEVIVVLGKGLETSTTNKQRRQQILNKMAAKSTPVNRNAR